MKTTKKMEWFDTTLRDGCQGPETNLTVYDKLKILKKLDDFGVDYVELGWPNASEAEMQTFQEARKLKLKNAKIVAFGSTKRKGVTANKDETLQAILKTKAPVACIFGKAIKSHVIKQLKITPRENLDLFKESVAYLKKNKRKVFVDFEHYFDGFKDDQRYAVACLLTAAKAGADRLILCDTNGGTLPDEAIKIIRQTKELLEQQKCKTAVGVHFHNDSGCGVANSVLAAPHVVQIQGTINGLGERTGNADLCGIIPNVILKKGFAPKKIKLEHIKKVSDMVTTLASLSPRNERPYVGDSAFKHKAGVHVDAIVKGASYEHIIPSKVGNKRRIILSSLSGNANVTEMLKEFGVKAQKSDPRVKKLRKEIERLENSGYDIDALPAEKYLLKEQYFGKWKEFFSIENWKIKSIGRERDEAEISGNIKGKPVQVMAVLEDAGPVGALYKSLQKLVAREYKQIQKVSLANYKVRITQPKGAQSVVRVYIEFKENGSVWGNVGVSPNIIEASLEAISKGFQYYLLKKK